MDAEFDIMKEKSDKNNIFKGTKFLLRILFKDLEKKLFCIICMSSYFSFWPKSWSATEILDMPIVSEQVYVH